MEKTHSTNVLHLGSYVWIIFEDRIPLQACSSEEHANKVMQYLEKQSPTSFRYSKAKIRYVG